MARKTLPPDPNDLTTRGTIRKQKPSVFYDPAFCERVVEMGKQGLCVEEMALELGCERKSLYNWIEAHEEFKQAMEDARDCEFAYYMKRLRNAFDMPNVGGQATMMKLAMQMRFPERYRETTRVEHTGADGGAIKYETKSNEEILSSLTPAERQALAASDPKVAALFGITQQHTTH